MGILELRLSKINREVVTQLENCIYHRLPLLQSLAESEFSKIFTDGPENSVWTSIIIQNSIVLNVVKNNDVVKVYNQNLDRNDEISIFSASLIATLTAGFNAAISAYMREERWMLQTLLNWHAELLVFIFDGQHVPADEQIIIQSHIEGFGEVLLSLAEDLKKLRQ